MAMDRWLGVSFVIAIAAVFSACSGGKQTTGAGGAGTGGASVSVTSSTGAGTGGGASSTGTGDVDAGPIPCKLLSSYSTVPSGPCNVLQQDCPAGKTCTPVPSGSTFTTTCVGNTGLKTAGEACFGANDCDAKLFCVAGKCTPVCCRENDEPCNGGICNINVAFDIYAVFVCSFAPKCELLTANACAAGLDCHIQDATQGLATCGQPSGANAPDLGSCTFLNDCANMEQCFGGDNACHFYCDVTGGAGLTPGLGGCPDAQICLSKYQGQTINFGVPNVGLCFSNGSPPPVDAGDDAGDDAGNDAGPGDAGGD